MVTAVSHRRLFFPWVLSLIAARVAAFSTFHFHTSSTPTRKISRYATTPSDTEQLQNEIAELKELAAHRLDALLEQMEELKQMNALHEPDGVESISTNRNDETNHKETIKSPSSVKAEFREESKKVPVESSKEEAAKMNPVPLNLLDDTTWKIVFNIGRESGTWMPATWAMSGDRLLFQCTIQFASSFVEHESCYDEFFQGSANTKQLIISDAFIIPRGVGNNSVGRRSLPVKSLGAYKVCRGCGPYGTDIVRLYIELLQDVTVPDHVSDVHCPAGRIYATCGYFAIPSKHNPATPSLRDTLQEQYNDALHEYEHLQAQVDADQRSLLSMDHLKMMKEVWTAKKNMERLATKLLEARQREPEKSTLRLNKAQTVGLTREGGVCYKVHKGLALEYHILGRIEVGYVVENHPHEMLSRSESK
jgi:hypothetical protein